MAACAPYVEQVIDAALLVRQLPNPSLHTQATKVTALELAILLLEILHHKLIETWAAENRQGSTVTFWKRMQVATCWLELSTDKLLPDHLKTVEACLAQCVRGN